MNKKRAIFEKNKKNNTSSWNIHGYIRKSKTYNFTTWENLAEAGAATMNTTTTTIIIIRI